MSEPQTKRRMDLVDDGTLDTVFKCGDCGGLERYFYDPEWTEGDVFNHKEDSEEAYREWRQWALNDAEERHECLTDD